MKLSLLVFSLLFSSIFALASTPLESLKAGNERFVSEHTHKTGQSKKDIQRLSKGQSPQSIVLSCSDSRVPPEIVFDQTLGEMFTVRTAGEALSPEAIASIEYAISKLGSHLVVVLGHTDCGAVKAAVDTLGGKSAGSKNLDLLVEDIQPRIKSSADNLTKASLENATGISKDLIERSKIISDAVHSGKVKIAVALYNIDSGKVEFEK